MTTDSPTDRICTWLIEQGYTSGWVVTGTEITLWLNSEPQPEIPAELLQPT
jgi:hypothetical protein